MKYLGLDLSLTGTGWHILSPDGNVGGVISPHAKLRGAPRLDLLERTLRGILAEHIADPTQVRVCIEDYVCGVNAKTVFGMAEWGGIVRLMLFRMGVSWITISNTSLKQFVTSMGNAQKDQMMLALYKTWGWEFMDNNQADACGLALVAQAVDKHPVRPLTAVQEKAISRVEHFANAEKAVKISVRRQKTNKEK